MEEGMNDTTKDKVLDVSLAVLLAAVLITKLDKLNTNTIASIGKFFTSWTK
jgi:hypothetical protein